MGMQIIARSRGDCATVRLNGWAGVSQRAPTVLLPRMMATRSTGTILRCSLQQLQVRLLPAVHLKGDRNTIPPMIEIGSNIRVIER